MKQDYGDSRPDWNLHITTGHGGMTDGTRQYKSGILDFSANISPLGVPDGVRAALKNASRHVDAYPDPLCRRLRTAIAQAEGLPPEWIFCGGGASDIIWRIALSVSPIRRAALVTAPAFSEYETAVRTCGLAVEYYDLQAESNFLVRPDFPDRITGDISLVFLCQPNNPTGVPVPMDTAYRVLDRCRETGARLVWDECFLPFMDHPERYTLRDALAGCPNLIILRAFTKLYGMAGVRLGYALCSDTDFLERLRLCGPPWNVSYPAQEAGIAALRETDYIQSLRELITRERPRIYQELSNLRPYGLRVIPGTANFLLFHSPVRLQESLYQHGIIPRSCGNFRNLDVFWYRIAIRTAPENDRLLYAVRDGVRNPRSV